MSSSVPPIPTLTTERLILRAFRDEDLDAYAEICADPEVMRYLGEGRTLSRAEAWRQMALIVGHWQLRGFGMWAIEEKESGRLVGRAGLFEPEGWPGFEAGWVLGRAWWGKGYATEAAREALRYAFEDLDRDHVISLIRPDNLPSIVSPSAWASSWRARRSSWAAARWSTASAAPDFLPPEDHHLTLNHGSKCARTLAH